MDSFSLSFSSRAELYASARPSYPPELFKTLADLAPHRRLAWDAGTGSGQAAVGLAEYFDRVVATDASSEQLAHARKHPRIDYLQHHSDQTSLVADSVALVTAACAAHWFNLTDFYTEVRRVSEPGAIVALWSYFYPETGGSEDALIRKYFENLIGPLVPKHQNYYMRYYADLPFPFEHLSVSSFKMEVSWKLEQLLAFMGTYSTRLKYQELYGADPVSIIHPELAAIWGDPEDEKLLNFPLGFKVGTVRK